MSDNESSSSFGTPPPITKNPYEILGVPTISTAAEIRSAYRKLALTVHPDKVPEDKRDVAKIAFQELTFAYGVLSDEARRKRFDETGNTSETAEGGFDWKAFYKAQMADLITTESLKKFKEEYQGSEEERQAVIAAYQASEGSMDKIFESVMCSDVLDDEERFREIINEALDAGQTKSFRNFTHENKASKKRRRAKAEAERREAEAYAKELGIHGELFNSKKAEAEGVEDGDGEGEAADKGSKKSKGKKAKKADAADDISGLRNLIQKRSNNRMEEMMSNLEAKYLPKPKAKKKATTTNSKRKKAMDIDEEAELGPSEPTEEQFRAACARMEGGEKIKDAKGARGKAKAAKEDSADTEPRRSKRIKSEAKAESLRILVVNDNPINKIVLVRYLKKHNYFLNKAKNDPIAFNTVKTSTKPYEIMLIDLQMPVMNGFDLTTAIHKLEFEENHAPTTIITLTGLNAWEERKKATERGINVFLTKPVPLSLVQVELDKWKSSSSDTGSSGSSFSRQGSV